MNKTLIATVAGVLLIGAAAYGGYRIGLSHGTRSTQADASASNPTGLKAGDIDPQTGKRVLYWHDPMVPGQRFDKPGKSPFMDMQLVPVYADGDAGGSGVAIDSRVAQNLGIRTAEAQMGRLGTVLEAPGNVAVDERSVQVIQARTSAFVQQVSVRATLDPVRRGQTLVSLYSPDWVAAQEEYLAVSRQAAHGQSNLAGAAEARMLQAGMTPGQISAVAASGKLQPALAIISPIDGVVTEVAVRDGMTVTPGMTLFRLADLSRVWVIAEVPEAQIRSVAPGAPVKVSAAGLTEPATGKVDAILPDVNAATRTIKVRIVLPNQDKRLVPGIFATVRFDGSQDKAALLIPSEAVIRTGQRSIVMVGSGQAGFVPTEIRTGREADGRVEVLQGLQAGQKVVTSGQFLIDSEASLRGTSERITVPSAAAAPAAAITEHEGTGRIEAVTGDGLTLSHGPIPSLHWGAMTMDFAAPPTGLPKGLKPGDRVRFRFHLDKDGTAVLSSVEPAANGAGGKP
ncbi:efflux RND transporter periplasmic adaptor subunit [Ralstonia solanacearum]|uniref:Secretion protein of the copper-transporting efflux system cuscfba n=1 Tax=Ralstonia solanacearum (strain Po82) TaxID=1031711 RepID=F6GB77_RALS8|nr:efflux RND transporter periplasmic adaptor subunit [Ralstonia solanacearum]AEG72278.1 secretion protein of the copper-transporting efflux system cuscfba [Ralstonia solanacearum Po82]AMP71185.1 RND transporter MFP subunit [Ralstonia solanacearum]AYB63475.1 efflux RND transporter periplasmic adaptor subunit [Ralstonia solanacearum]MBB6588240.1 efflux RND transporter periplasmic adaptor subunit [Ralstonia solanacearum]MCG3574948.1 efflux RND transporter periplasmic adaptor subunit [Ralstonia s